MTQQLSDTQDFLFELGTEELPPRALKSLAAALKDNVLAGLDAAALGYNQAVHVYATPRRLALWIKDLSARQADKKIERRGPAIAVAFTDDGQPSKAALGFAASCGLAFESLDRIKTDKGEWLVFRSTESGLSVAELLPAIIDKALAQLPIPKRMRWGSLRVEFVRPVHWAVMLFGSEVIHADILGVTTGRETRGHRFHHPHTLSIATPADYQGLLQKQAYVLADFDQRRATIEAQVAAITKSGPGQAVIDADLLDEVTAMVEWPVAVLGQFDPDFLQLPAEVLVSAMKGHQKYFHMVDDKGNLLPAFITISNIESRDRRVVQAGNERVIRPRLADATFFWKRDSRTPLADRVAALKSVIFQKQLGSLYDKTQRVKALAGHIGEQMGADVALCQRAALLSRADLMTDMVAEFPELQGVMGRYYARLAGEPDAVAVALDEFYQPRFAADAVAASAAGQVLALADKLDTLAGLFAINALPTGTKDPFALRRAALGVLRTMIESSLTVLDLQELIARALQAYPDDLQPQKKSRQKGKSTAGQAQVKVKPVADTLFDFMMDRLRVYYANQQVSPDVFAAVLAQRPTRPVDFDLRIQAVNSFQQLPEAAALAAAYKRSDNILRKFSGTVPEKLNSDLLSEPAEQQLAAQLQQSEAGVAPLLEQQDYRAALLALATLRTPVDQFFDQVMVMVDDVAVRDNRLALLHNLRQLLSQVADLSCLVSQEK